MAELNGKDEVRKMVGRGIKHLGVSFFTDIKSSCKHDIKKPPSSVFFL
jgi:pyridoxine/pyridoxamine 5'-phosphate oxidase